LSDNCRQKSFPRSISSNEKSDFVDSLLHDPKISRIERKYTI
jgi:hypothetical protein